MQMALDALKWYVEEDDVIEDMVGNEPWVEGKRDAESSIEELRAELAKPEPEPIGYFIDYGRAEWVEHDLKQLADDDKDCITAIPLYRKEDL